MNPSQQIKLESLQDQCPCLVQKLGLEAWIEGPSAAEADNSTWRVTSHAARPLSLCNTGKDQQDNHTLVNTRDLPLAHLMAVHRTGSADRLYDFYDRETADLVTQVYMEDLARFGYQVWPGPPHDFKLV